MSVGAVVTSVYEMIKIGVCTHSQTTDRAGAEFKASTKMTQKQCRAHCRAAASIYLTHQSSDMLSLNLLFVRLMMKSTFLFHNWTV